MGIPSLERVAPSVFTLGNSRFLIHSLLPPAFTGLLIRAQSFRIMTISHDCSLNIVQSETFAWQGCPHRHRSRFVRKELYCKARSAFMLNCPPTYPRQESI